MGKTCALILMTHGTWGSALLESASLVAGEIPEAVSLPLLEGQQIEAYETEGRTLLARLRPKEVILVADLLGGSPYYAAARLGYEYDCPVLTGLSLELLLALCRRREQMPSWEAARAALEDTRQAAILVNEYVGNGLRSGERQPQDRCPSGQSTS